MIGAASGTIAAINGQTPSGCNSIVQKHKSTSISLINRKLQNVQDATSLPTVLTIVLLLAIEVETYTELSMVIAFRESCIGNQSGLELIETDYFDVMWLRAQHSLICFSSSNMFRQDSDVQKICRIIVPMFVVHTQLVTYRHSPATESLKAQFLEAIADMDLQKLWEQYHELMVWAFMFVCHSCGEPAWRERLLIEMAKGGQGKMRWEWQEVRKILLGFFFVERLHGQDFRNMCEEVRLLDESMAPVKAEK
ncbi:MAG: hypothetical protein Q9195_007627 [Heterodermia aff. obscurata]